MRALPVASIALLLALGAPLHADIIEARYAEPTARYTHGILGDAIEHGALLIVVSRGLGGRKTLIVTLPENRVFEDTAPRLADVDNDGDMEVIVVETDVARGAQLAIYDETGKIAATPYIGTRFRWLAPVGVADLDGDGTIEIAYIDRPHLAKTLRVWRFEEGGLTPVVDLGGLTNHRIGERDIAGGIRVCGSGPEMITASADWSVIMATRLRDGALETRPVGAHRDRQSFARALRCADE
jgi:hypothetical protein